MLTLFHRHRPTAPPPGGDEAGEGQGGVPSGPGGPVEGACAWPRTRPDKIIAAMSATLTTVTVTCTLPPSFTP